MYSLNDLNTKKASETPYTFEFIFCGKTSGILLSVIGQQSETFEARALVLAKAAAMQKALEDAAIKALKLDQAAEDDQIIAAERLRNRALTNRLVAARLTEWAGITEPLTDETAYQFVVNTDGALDQVLAASNKIGNFIKL